MFNLNSSYPYMEEVNEGIVKAVKGSRETAQPQGRPGTLPKLLDVGCGYGQLGEALSRLGFRVYGIEAKGEAVLKARKRLEAVIPQDLTDFRTVRAKLRRLLKKETGFDAIVFSDVLEHVVDPLQVLEFYKGFLKPGGRVFISLPNLVNWEQRLGILFGAFNYQDTGVLDRTHLRFFTFKTAKLLLKEAGYLVERTDYTPYFVRALLPLIKSLLSKGPPQADTGGLMASPLYGIYEKFIYPVEYWLGGWWKSMFAFRMIFIAVAPKKGGTGSQ